jgi:carbon dioxide concentrating mechanism protein CcmK
MQILTFALGMIETLGIPAALALGDAMVKAGRVTLVGYENTDMGRITVVVRGPVAEVQAAVAAGLAMAQQVHGGKVLAHHIIPRPQANLEVVLPIGLSSWVEQFDQPIRFPPPLSP